MRHASVFSGIGAPEVAAAMLGWENVFHCEINPFGRKVLEYWFPESKSYEDITKTDFREWRGKVDVLTGGFPCQPFSYAGKRGGRNDERYLWPQMLRVIDEVRPTWFVGENVAGITTMVEGGILTEMGGEATLFETGDFVHRYELDCAFTVERVCSDLEQLGYSVQPVAIPAAAVGAPHRRERIFFIAFEKSDRDGYGRRYDGTERNHGDIRNAGAGDSERICGNERDDSSNCPDSGDEGMQRREILSDRHKHASDSFRERLAAAVQSGSYGAQEWHDEGRSAGMYSDDAWIEGTWWDNFPTVSPVHTRDDGLSKIMDGTAVGFHKWRNESIKAYGNAIVPQVMYRIFQCIETVMNR